jgi:hypothetical protein
VLAITTNEPPLLHLLCDLIDLIDLCATRYGLCHASPDSEEEPYVIYSILLTSSNRELCDQSKL